MKHEKSISIVWFRQDLRIADNPALAAAHALGEILPIYIVDDCVPSQFNVGTASKLWLAHSLQALDASLHGKLNIYAGKASKIIAALIEQYTIKNVFWNICYEPWYLEQEQSIKQVCTKTSTEWQAYNGNYLWSPGDILKDDGTCYKVFTAYKNKLRFFSARTPISAPKTLHCIKDTENKTTIADVLATPKNRWSKNIEALWDIGEKAAHTKLHMFIEQYLSDYKEGRNYPAKQQTSLLSAHLHFGEISPAYVWHTVQSAGHTYANKANIECFLNELIWREFACYVLYHFTTVHTDNYRPVFDRFPWSAHASFLHAWQTGNTGYPLVDAGMRQLRQTGYMHNRVRMVVGSFLVKNLHMHWHHGRDWFWDCLVDADLANNSVNWQWVAGTGIDAAPYFRVFNPILQGEKFDKQGEYTRAFVAELRDMPNKYLFKPWRAPAHVLQAAGVELGTTYPNPIVDFAVSRKKALELYRKL